MSADTTGRWGDILAALGIDRRFLRKRNGPCPMCGGKDRWKFDDREGRGTWFCSHCGAGDGFGLVKIFCRVDFPEAAKMVESVIGSARIEPPKDRICEDEARSRANAMWRDTRGDSPILQMYLKSRHVADRPWRDIRFHPSLFYSLEGPEFPAMVAMVRDASGRPATLHRTYLRADGAAKAEVPAPRRTSHGLSLPKGSAIRLCPVENEIGVGEGIETCMAATLIFGTPTWSLLNAGNLASWWPPQGVESVTVYGDNDRNFVGQSAAYRLAERLASKFLVSVKIPPNDGHDWADELSIP